MPIQGLRCEIGDRIGVSVFNSATYATPLRVSAWFLTETPSGPRLRPYHIADITPGTTRAESQTSYPVPYRGDLLSLQAAPPGNVRRGQTYVQLGLLTEAREGLTLAQGYVTGTKDVFWAPWSSVNEDAISGAGILRSITGTNPAAGVEITEAVPTNARWLLGSMRFRFVSDANVINRRCNIIIDDGSSNLVHINSYDDHAASTTQYYNVVNDGELLAAATSNRYILLPLRIPMLQGWRIRTATNNIQAGDDYDAPQLRVEEWIED